MNDDQRLAVCTSCGGMLKPWGASWMHEEHSDWRNAPHHPIPKDETA